MFVAACAKIFVFGGGGIGELKKTPAAAAACHFIINNINYRTKNQKLTYA
jgi:hypothetical protein